MRIAFAPMVLFALCCAVPVPQAIAADSFEDAVRDVHKAFSGKEPGILANALDALGEYDGENAARVLFSMIARPEVHPLVVETGIENLQRFRDPAVAAFLLKEGKESRGPKLMLALESMARHPDAGVEAFLIATLESSDARTRTVAVTALAARKPRSAEVRAALEPMLLDSDAAVRSATVSALSRGGVTAGLPLMLAMVREKGRLFGDCWSALRRVSGERYAPDPAAWEKWWRTVPGEEKWSFDPPPPVSPATSVVVAGLPTWSKRIVFVVDLSDGMGDAPGYQIPDIVPRAVAEKGGEALEQWKAVKTRLDHAAALLRTAIEGLPADVSFDIVFGAESTNALFRRLEPATGENKSRAISRLRSLSARGRQDFFGLMKAAMGVPERDPTGDAAHVSGADTVIYVGTALPSHGAETDRRRILATIRRWNLTRQVSFLGIGVGNHDGDLLSELASTEPRGGNTSVP